MKNVSWRHFELKPYLRRDSQWAVELHEVNGNKSYGFLMWLESSGDFCTCNNPDLNVKVFDTWQEAREYCDDMQGQYEGAKVG